MTEIVRIASPHVRPLEVWDLEVNGRAWYRSVGAHRADSPAFAREVVRGIAVLSARHHTDRVSIGGGLIARSKLRAELSARCKLPLTFVEGHPAVRAGLRMLGGGAVIDLGQTALKIGTRRGVRTVSRDLDRFPIASADRPSKRADRSDLIDWLSSEIPDVSRLILALPARVDRLCKIERCTYAALSGRRFVPPLARTLRCKWIGVINDAELAAHDVRARPGERVLYLSLGFGPGAAVVTCPERASIP